MHFKLTNKLKDYFFEVSRFIIAIQILTFFNELKKKNKK